MTVRFNSSGDGVRFSTSSPPSMTAITVAVYRKVVTQNAGTDRTELFIERTGDFAAMRHKVSSGNIESLDVPGDADNTFSPADPESDGTWAMLAYVCDGTGANGAKLYSWALGAADGSYNLAQGTHSGGATINLWGLGNYGGSYRDGEYCFVKIWNAALSLSELQAERVQGKPVRTSDVWAYHRLADASDTSDGSGNGKTLTFQGSVANGADSEPVPWEITGGQPRAARGRGIPGISDRHRFGRGW